MILTPGLLILINLITSAELSEAAAIVPPEFLESIESIEDAPDSRINSRLSEQEDTVEADQLGVSLPLPSFFKRVVNFLLLQKRQQHQEDSIMTDKIGIKWLPADELLEDNTLDEEEILNLKTEIEDSESKSNGGHGDETIEGGEGSGIVVERNSTPGSSKASRSISPKTKSRPGSSKTSRSVSPKTCSRQASSITSPGPLTPLASSRPVTPAESPRPVSPTESPRPVSPTESPRPVTPAESPVSPAASLRPASSAASSSRPASSLASAVDGGVKKSSKKSSPSRAGTPFPPPSPRLTGKKKSKVGFVKGFVLKRNETTGGPHERELSPIPGITKDDASAGSKPPFVVSVPLAGKKFVSLKKLRTAINKLNMRTRVFESEPPNRKSSTIPAVEQRRSSEPAVSTAKDFAWYEFGGDYKKQVAAGIAVVFFVIYLHLCWAIVEFVMEIYETDVKN